MIDGRGCVVDGSSGGFDVVNGSKGPEGGEGDMALPALWI